MALSKSHIGMIAQRALDDHQNFSRQGSKGKGTGGSCSFCPFPLAPPMLVEYKNVHPLAVNKILPQNELKHTPIHICVQKYTGTKERKKFLTVNQKCRRRLCL